MSEEKVDLVVLGGGPGGYTAAIRAAELGLSVILIEKDKVGGTCLHRGCIPTKALIACSDVVSHLKKAEDFGVHIDGYHFDYDKMKLRKDAKVAGIWGGLKGLMLSHGVKTIEGEGCFISKNSIKISGNEPCLVHFDRAIVATGSVPASLPFIEIDYHKVHNSDTILEVTTLPKSLTILGGGYIGCEFASLFAELGVQVTIVEFLPTILHLQGPSIAKFMANIFTKRGINIRCDVAAENINTTGDGVSLKLSDGSSVESDMLLVSVGRKSFSEGSGIEKLAIPVDKRGFIQVNDKMETQVPNIYAIGDVTGRSMLAHAAAHMGIVAASNAAGKESSMQWNAIPAVVFTHPEVATVGYTSIEECNKNGFEAMVTRFPFQALGKAQVADESEGFAEILTEKGSDRILGAIMIGFEAGNMISEMALAIKNELTIECVSATIHPHPTLGEVWMELADLAEGMPINFPPPKRKVSHGS